MFIHYRLYLSRNFAIFLEFYVFQKYTQLTLYITDDPIADWSRKLIHLREQLRTVTKPYETGTHKLKQAPNLTSLSPIKPQGMKAKSSPSSTKKKGSNSANMSKKPFNRAQITKLTNQLNELSDEQKISVLETIEEEEPNAVPADGGSLSVDPFSLKRSTLSALKAKLDTISNPKEQ